MRLTEEMIAELPEAILEKIAPHGITNGMPNPTPNCNCVKCMLLKAFHNEEIDENKLIDLWSHFKAMKENILNIKHEDTITKSRECKEFLEKHDYPAFANAFQIYQDFATELMENFPSILAEHKEATKNVHNSDREDVFEG